MDFSLKGGKENFVNKAMDGFKIGFLGNVRNYKDINLLINAYKKCRKSTTDVKLIIAGPAYDNYFKKTLEKLVLESTGIQVIDGFVPDQERFAELVDVFVCPYDTNFPQFKYGFFPSSVAFLGIYGRPIICPICDSTFDIIKKSSNAILYESHNEDSLASAIYKVYRMNITDRDNLGKI